MQIHNNYFLPVLLPLRRVVLRAPGSGRSPLGLAALDSLLAEIVRLVVLDRPVFPIELLLGVLLEFNFFCFVA